MVVRSRSNLSLLLMKLTVSEYLWFLTLDIFSANLFTKVCASIPIPPDVENTTGVNVALSTCNIRAPYSLFFCISWFLYIAGIVLKALLEGAEA